MDLNWLRNRVLDAIRGLGVLATAPEWETPLKAEGRLRGYRFEFDGVRAFWFAESNTIELYSDQWSQLKVVPLDRRLAGSAA